MIYLLENTSNMRMSKNKALVINLSTSIIAFVANLIINLFLPPYIVKSLGIEANGFIALANNFVTYGALIAIALNSMAGRFITIEVHKQNFQKANIYYSSVTVANIFLAVLLLFPSILIIYYLENIINITPSLLMDVKILFALVILSFLLSTAFSSWKVSTFVTNKLYIHSIVTMQSQVLRVIIIVGLFTIFQPSIYFVGIGTLIITIYITLFSFYYKQKLLPQIKLQKKHISFSSMGVLIKSGFWNTVIHGGQLLLSGFDLLIANIFLGSTQMGLLALAKTLPLVLTQLASTLTSVFAPSLTISFAKGNIEELKNELKKSMKLLGVTLTIPLSLLVVFGENFYSLWIPTADAKILQTLSVLTIFGMIFTSGIQTLYNVFTVVNRLKLYSLLILMSGVISAILVFILLSTTNLGIFAVAAVSSIVNLARNMFFTVPFGAKYLKLKWNTFYPEVIYSVICVILSVGIGLVVKYIFIDQTWISLIYCAIITAFLGLIINMYIVLNRDERRSLMEIFFKKLKFKK